MLHQRQMQRLHQTLRRNEKMSDLDQTSVTIGDLLARVKIVEQDMVDIKRSQAEILQILHEARGGWRIMIVLGTLISGIIGYLSSHDWSFR